MLRLDARERAPSIHVCRYTPGTRWLRDGGVAAGNTYIGLADPDSAVVMVFWKRVDRDNAFLFLLLGAVRSGPRRVVGCSEYLFDIVLRITSGFGSIYGVQSIHMYLLRIGVRNVYLLLIVLRYNWLQAPCRDLWDWMKRLCPITCAYACAFAG